MADNLTDKEHLSWGGLTTYTNDLKSWIYSLLHKIHARIGHVEEELYRVEQSNKATYSIKKTTAPTGVVYSLINDVTKESSGDITIETGGVVVSTWEEDLNV